jgi:hypothetical protein
MFKRRSSFVFFIPTLVVTTVIALGGMVRTSTAATTVRLSPGDDIQAAVNANPKGSTFLLLPGVYRMQQITPKDGDIFTGKDSVTLNGSQVLTFVKDTAGTGLWKATAKASKVQQGNCSKGSPLCAYTQDLFIDSQWQIPVATAAEVTAGSWYFDRASNTVYLPSDPSSHVVEIGMCDFAFGGNATGVEVQFLTVEKYANEAQEGAIGGNRWSPGLGSQWNVSNVEVRWNHGTGIGLGNQSVIQKSFIHHNGQLGIAFYKGANCTAANNEISWNNYAGFSPSWEAGGSKFWSTTNLAVQSNYVHDNTGPGLWSDYNNVGALYEHNTVVNNLTAGIKHEISYSAIVRYNVLKGNGALGSEWLGSAQVLVMNSSHVEIYGNTMEVPSSRGGVALVNQADRGSGSQGPWVASNNYVHNNTTTYLGVKGRSGLEDDSAMQTATGNKFDSNVYVAPVDGAIFWVWSTTARLDWKGFQATGQEPHGKCCS